MEEWNEEMVSTCPLPCTFPGEFSSFPCGIEANTKMGLKQMKPRQRPIALSKEDARRSQEDETALLVSRQV